MGNCGGKKNQNKSDSEHKKTSDIINIEQNQDQTDMNRNISFNPPIEYEVSNAIRDVRSIQIVDNFQQTILSNRKRIDTTLRIEILKNKLFPQLDKNLRKSVILSRRDLAIQSKFRENSH